MFCIRMVRISNGRNHICLHSSLCIGTDHSKTELWLVRFLNGLDHEPNMLDHPNTEHLRYSSPHCIQIDKYETAIIEPFLFSVRDQPDILAQVSHLSCYFKGSGFFGEEIEAKSRDKQTISQYQLSDDELYIGKLLFHFQTGIQYNLHAVYQVRISYLSYKFMTIK